MLLNIKFLLNQLPQLNFNTLKFHIVFFREVVQNEVHNRMTSYNIAVTVGPNIFRPQKNETKDLLNVGIFYDLLIRMIENFDVLFDKNLSYENLIERYTNNVANRCRKSLKSVGGVGVVQGELLELLRQSTKRYSSKEEETKSSEQDDIFADMRALDKEASAVQN